MSAYKSKVSAAVLCLSLLAVNANAANDEKPKGASTQVGSSTSVPAGQLIKPPAAASGVSSKPTPASEEPENTSATFGDWALECRTIATGDTSIRNCEVTQAVRAGEQNQLVAQVAVGRASSDMPYNLTILLPVNIALPSEVKISFEGEKSDEFLLNWSKCVPNGCFASLVLTEQSLNRLKGMTGKPTVLWRSNTGQGIQFSLSMRGFPQAMAKFQRGT